MYRSFMGVAAVAAALLSTPALADVSPFAQDWIDKTTRAVSREVPAAAVTAPVAVRARIGADRRFEHVELVGTSGSSELDEAALHSVRRHRMATPPTELRGRRVTFHVAPLGPAAQAQSAALR